MELNYYCEYYAQAIEDSYYVKRGTIIKLKNKKEALEVKQKGCYRFPYSQNMHYDEDELPCKVFKKETIWSEL